MAQDLSGLYISQSFQNLVQRSASGAFNVLATATGTEFIPISASYAISSSRSVSASRADSALSASYALTASYAENALTKTLQEVLTAGNQANLGFSVTGSVKISGSLVTGRSDNFVNTQDSVVLGGRLNNNQATSAAIVGGINNEISASGERSVVIGGEQNKIQGTSLRGGIFAGGLNEQATKEAAIIGGASNTIQSGISGSVIVAGNAISGTQVDKDFTAFVSGLDVQDGGLIEASGSIKLGNVGTGSAGQVIGVDASGIAKWETPASTNPFPFTGSAQITGSLAVTGSTNISLNSPGNSATLTIEDKGNSDFNIGARLLMTGSNVGIIETSGNMNMRLIAGGSTITSAGNQYLFDKNDSKAGAGDFKINDPGSRTAFYKHENLSETGSIRFANPDLDTGIAIRMDDNKMALQMYSGSAFVPIIERKKSSKQVNLYDSTSSTGSSAQVLTSNANGGIEWAAGGGGGAAFPFTGSAQISGSLIVSGSVSLGNIDSSNTINPGAVGAFVQGDGNSINSTGEDNAILGGEGNAIQTGAYSAILGAAASTMNNVDTSVIVGGYQNNVQGTRTFTLGGNQNTVNNNSSFSGIIGGQSNQINGSVTASVVIGGKNIAAARNEMVYVPGLEVVTGGANITGSIIGSGNVRAGQSAAAFASDSVEVGSATVPVQYGNIIIHGSNTRDLGNKFNSYQIVTQGGNTVSLANTAFSGLGNDVHLLQWGGNSVGRADNIKLWSSGSAGVLNVSTDLKITDANKLTMSGSIELANSTGSVGQVIGVDAGGKAKWETAGGGGGTTAQNWQTTNYTQATAPGCDFVFATASIAGGTYAVGDKIEVRSMVSQTNGSGTSYLTWAHSTGNTPINVGYPSGFKQLAGSQSGGNGLIYVQKTLYILSATETAVWTPGNSNETYNVGVTGGDPVEIYNIDWTVDSTIWYGACIDNAGHTVREFGGTVRKIN